MYRIMKSGHNQMEKYLAAYLARPSFDNIELCMTHVAYNPAEVFVLRKQGDQLSLGLLVEAAQKYEAMLGNWYPKEE